MRLNRKKEKILEAANRLKEMGFRKDWIASTLAEYSHDLGVSRGYIYEALPDEFKSKKRSEAQKEAKAAKVLSQGSDLEERQLRELVVENDGNSSGDTTGDDKGKRVTKRWKEAAVIRSRTLDDWIPLVNSIINAAIIEDGYVRVPMAIWQDFIRVANSAVG